MLRSTVSAILGVVFLAGSLAEGEPLRYVFTHYPPANYRSQDGQYRGFLVDIVMEAVVRRMEIPVTISIFPWKRCQMLVEGGEADMITTVRTPERSVYTVTHQQPIWTKEWRIHTYEGHPHRAIFNEFSTIDQLKTRPYRVISYIGNGWSKTMLEDAGIPVFNATTVEGMYRMLAARRGDILIEDDILVAPALKELRLRDQIVPTEGVVARSNFHMLLGRKSRFAGIVPRLDKVVQEMWEDGTMHRILGEYRRNGLTDGP